MSLSPLKLKLLEHMLLNDKPARATQIAKECGNDFKPVMMHLIGLTRMGYITSPEKGQYQITQKGKTALRIPETTQECAKTLLSQTPHEKAFHFYTDLEKSLNIYAHGLQEFSEKITQINTNSIEFHLYRNDFQKWFTNLGDTELAKKMALLKETGIHGEQLRTKLHEIVENRCKALSRIT
jgi:predicted transcriptional regulator